MTVGVLIRRSKWYSHGIIAAIEKGWVWQVSDLICDSQLSAVLDP
jgi:hypothetical protein